MEQGSALKLAPGLVIGGKYRLAVPLARGGMGSVWIARHTQLDVELAVKFMEPKHAASPTSRARFEREAKAAANIKSPHIVHVQDYGLEGSVPYLVMERLHGEDLHTRLKREGRLSLLATAEFCAQIAKGLRRAHELGIVHRDLKPRNIFLAQVDDLEIVKILDFGIAKETSQQFVSGETGTGEIIGSPQYMSPEHIRTSKNVDARSDIWSLGVILFRALTGKLPFGSDQLGDVLAQILADPIPKATSVAPDLPVALDAFFDKALARDREARFQTVQELSEALTAIARAEGHSPRRATLQSGLFEAPPPFSTASPELPSKTLPLAAPLPLPVATPLPGTRPALNSQSSLSPVQGNTLATAGGTIRIAPNQSRRGALFSALGVGALVVGGLVLFFTLKSPTTADESQAIQESNPLPEAPAASTPPTPTPSSTESAAPSASAPEALASAESPASSAAAPSASASASSLAQTPPIETAKPQTTSRSTGTKSPTAPRPTSKRPSWGF